jgi:type III secretion protein N (ATPase)
MSDITTPEQQKAANHLRNLLAKYEEIELLVRVGEYQKGSDPIADEALEKISEIRTLLQQNIDEKIAFEDTVKQMQALSTV